MNRARRRVVNEPAARPLRARLCVIHTEVDLDRSPRSGAYQSLTIYEESEAVSPLAAPHASLRIADFGV